MATAVQKRGNGQVQSAAAEAATRQVFMPLADVFETDESFVVTAEMPGVAADAIEVEVEGDVLRLHGRTSFAVPDGYRLIHGEYADGDYERVLALPDSVDAERITAAFSNGLLRIELPKAESARTRRIPLRAES